ncbi:hypothetical protein EI94DRAFT_1701612 [Lactarius quietus]|nr:hypothetical protein EI94DRAFT_1701612 [Lactarius quietus]
MVSPHSPTSSNSSALFGSDDTSFLEALGAAVLPGDVAKNESARRLSYSPSPILESSSLEPPPCAQPTSNARPSIGSDDEQELPTSRTPPNAGLHPQHPLLVISDDDEPQLEPPPPAQSRYRKRAHSISSNDEPAHSSTDSPTGNSSLYLDSDTYGASRFGEFGEYMRRKRAKLQIQNTEIGDSTRGKASGSQLLKGLSIHINGWTEPSVQELRKLIVENGGIYQAYIDKKTLVQDPSAPLHSPQPVSPTAPVPKYAKHDSNPAAKRAMADPLGVQHIRLRRLGSLQDTTPTQTTPPLHVESGVAHTSCGGPRTCGKGGSTLRLEPQTKQALMGKEKVGNKAERVIMHVDFDAFFVSAGLVSRPHLRGKPVVVCHSQHAQSGAGAGASSTSEIASASYEARKFGVKNGMSLQQARRLCPDLVTIPYEFERYRQLSLEFYTILMGFADDLQAVSVDEALIDVTSTLAQMRVVPTGVDDDGDNTSTDIAKELADSIRAQIKAATGCNASIGIAPNIMLARLATRRAKPAGSFHLLPAAFQDLLPDLDIQDLHGFGRAARDKATEKLGTTNLGELAGRSKAALCDALGNAMGETLHNSIRGIDDHKLESDKPRKSVSCDINYGIRFENDEQVEAFLHQMSEEVARRLDAINTKGRSLTLKIMKRDPSAPVEAPKFMGHGQCVTYNKQSTLVGPDAKATSDPRVIGSLSWRLLRTLNIPPHELRGISIQIQKLDAHTGHAPGHVPLPFRPAPNPSRAGTIAGPAQKGRASPSVPVTTAEAADLPSFSQVDMSVFEALPEDIRKELEAEYVRRSAPAPNKSEHSADHLPRANSAAPSRVDAGNDNDIRIRGRAVGVISSRGRRGFGRDQARGASSWVVRPRGRGRGGRGRGNAGSGPSRGGLLAFITTTAPAPVARQAWRTSETGHRRGGVLSLPRLAGRWAPPQGPHEYIPPPPPPQARFAETEKPGLRRGDAQTSPAVDVADVRRVVRAWVELFARHAPHAEDVALVGGYLVRCVATDVGTERAVGVMRWWGALLRRRWAVWEHADERDEEPEPHEDIRVEVVGMAWWRAYREVGDSLNEIVRKRFGGYLGRLGGTCGEEEVDIASLPFSRCEQFKRNVSRSGGGDAPPSLSRSVSAISATASVPPGLRYLTSSRETWSTGRNGGTPSSTGDHRFSKKGCCLCFTHHNEVEAILGAKLGERTYGAHFVRLEALRVGARIVKLDHTRADIYTYEARDVWCQRTRDLS